MKLSSAHLAAGTFASTAQGAASEVWHNYVTSVMPGLAGPYLVSFVGICTYIIALRLIPDQ